MTSNLFLAITILFVVVSIPSSLVLGFVSTNIRPLTSSNSIILLLKHPSSSSTLLEAADVRRNGEGSSSREKTSSLLNEFRIASGEIIDPYKVLQVERDATRDEIKAEYRKLSRMYHPDQIRFRKTLPGRCDTLEDAREEWERINLSYVILSDKRTRKRYDRNSVLADPGAALSKAAMGSIKWGMTNIAKGIFEAGTTAIDKSVTMAMDSLFKEKEENGVAHEQAEYQTSDKKNAFPFPSFPTLPNFQQPKKQNVEEDSYHVPINVLNPSPMLKAQQVRVEEPKEKKNNNILYFNKPQEYNSSRQKPFKARTTIIDNNKHP